VVQLADGRVGGPISTYMSTNHPDGVAGVLAQSELFYATQFMIFAEQDGEWVLDEILNVCIGECDAYWASYDIAPERTPAATPIATPDAWLPSRYS
jgi:hypothetical protein